MLKLLNKASVKLGIIFVLGIIGGCIIAIARKTAWL